MSVKLHGAGFREILDAIPFAITMGLGAFMLFRTKGSLAVANKAHARRLADRHQRGSDAYFEELRSLKAYRPEAVLWKRRLLGALLLIFSADQLLLIFYR